MPLYSSLASLSQTAGANAADGAVDAPSTIDQQLNLLASFIAQMRDNGTNLSAWQSGVPSILPATGSFTDASAAIRYKINGKSVFFSLVVTIITNGTAAGTIRVFLPWTAITESAFGGRESQTTGNAVAATISPASSTLTIVKYDNTYPGGNSYRIAINGVMETT